MSTEAAMPRSEMTMKASHVFGFRVEPRLGAHPAQDFGNRAAQAVALLIGFSVRVSNSTHVILSGRVILTMRRQRYQLCAEPSSGRA